MPQNTTTRPAPVLQPIRIVGTELMPTIQDADVNLQQARSALKNGDSNDSRDILYYKAIVEADVLRQELRRQCTIRESIECELATTRARLDGRQTVMFAFAFLLIFILMFVIECARDAVKLYFPIPRRIGPGTGLTMPTGRLNV